MVDLCIIIRSHINMFNCMSVLATCIYYVVRLMQCCYSLCVLQASIPTTLTTVAETVPISNVGNTHCYMSKIIDFWSALELLQLDCIYWHHN